MSHDIAYTSQHPQLFLLLHRHHYPPQCPARYPPNRSMAFRLELHAQLRPMLPDVPYTSHDPIALLLTTPLPPSSLVPPPPSSLIFSRACFPPISSKVPSS